MKYESKSVEKKMLRFFDTLSVLGFVKEVWPQPARIEYESNRFYHPDVLILFNNKRFKPWIIEGKGAYFNKSIISKDKHKFRAAIRYAREQGYVFHIVTSQDLSAVNDEILPFLKTHQALGVQKRNEKLIVEVLKLYGPMSPNEVVSLCVKIHRITIPIGDVWRLAADGKIFCDLTVGPQDTQVAARTNFYFSSLSKKILFRLPFFFVGGSHDPLYRRGTSAS